MYFYGFVQTYVLINFFIPLWRAEAITWENFTLAKRDTGSTKKGSGFAGWNFLHVIARYNLWRICSTALIQQNRAEFHGG